MSKSKPFEQWHPDAQRQCGYWLDIGPERCGLCERCKCEAQPAPQEPSAEEAVDWEREARKLLWLNHNCGRMPYGDDGEMQCCGWDFKRWPWHILKQRTTDASMARMAKEYAALQQQPADTIQAVREVYRDDRDAMAHGLLQMSKDLAEARRER